MCLYCLCCGSLPLDDTHAVFVDTALADAAKIWHPSMMKYVLNG
jgi:hypothetical protein